MIGFDISPALFQTISKTAVSALIVISEANLEEWLRINAENTVWDAIL
jgi:hypothetical protein